jgi:hypothetical protein
VTELLVDVLFQIRGERVIAQLPRADERRLRQRDGRANDLVLQNQVLRPQLGEPPVLDERVVRGRERGGEEAELAPKARARRVRRAQ